MAENQRPFRCDRGTLSPPQRLANGFLRADAFLTKTGVFEYLGPGGTVRRELRLPEEVFRKDSLESFRDLPVTIGHPSVLVTAQNAKSFQVGHSAQDVRRDSDMVRGTLVISDGAAIQAMERKNLRQVSNGYTLDLEMKPGVTQGIDGVPDGLAYDAIQRDIMGNHIAIVPEGRAGEDAIVRLDGFDVGLSSSAIRRDQIHFIGSIANPILTNMGLGDDFIVAALGVSAEEAKAILSGLKMPTEAQLERLAVAIGVPLPTLQSLIPGKTLEKETRNMDEFEVVLGGVPYRFKADSSAKVALQKQIAEAEAKAARADAALERGAAEGQKVVNELKTKLEAAEARADAAKEAQVKAEAQRDAALDPGAIQARVSERAALERVAAGILGERFDAAKSDGDLRREVVLAVQPDAKLDGKSKAYVEARFDAAVEIAGKQPKTTAPATRAVLETVQARRDEGAVDLDRMRLDAIRRRNEQWKKPVGQTNVRPA